MEAGAARAPARSYPRTWAKYILVLVLEDRTVLADFKCCGNKSESPEAGLSAHLCHVLARDRRTASGLGGAAVCTDTWRTRALQPGL